MVVRARRNKVVTGSAGMIDETGVSVTDLAPAGKVLVHGEYWDAISTRPRPTVHLFVSCSWKDSS